MEHEKTVTELIGKLKKNRDNVPLDVLKTKYATAYGQLCGQIKEELKQIASQFPPWIAAAKIREEYADEIVEIFRGLYASGGYAEKIGTAAFKEMDAQAAVTIAKDAAGKFDHALREYADTKDCIFVTRDNFRPDGPKPKIYNTLLGLFWDEDAKEWRRPLPGEETKPAFLIFLKGEEKA